MKQICCAAIGGFLMALCAAAQDNAATDQVKRAATWQNVPVTVKIIGRDMSVLSAPVTGAPYSADEVTTFTQTLADGTHIQREDKVTVYRDSQGRLRRETPGEITISDPVTGVAYTLDPNKLTAQKMEVMRKDVKVGGPPLPPPPLPAKTFAISRSPAASGRDLFFFFDGGTDPEATSANRQSLGSQSIEGVLSDGTSATETIPAGSIGNDRPIQVVDERWYSPELKTTVMTKHSDPRNGEEIFRLTNIHRGEPSPDLFQLPAGYQVVEAGGELKNKQD